MRADPNYHRLSPMAARREFGKWSRTSKRCDISCKTRVCIYAWVNDQQETLMQESQPLPRVPMLVIAFLQGIFLYLLYRAFD